VTASGIPPAGLKLLSELERNNSTDWFHSHKAEYRELVQEPMLRVVEQVNAELAKFAPAYVTEKKNPLSRPNRDTRFSKDKSPYRTDISVVFPCRGREKHASAGFFIRVHPEGAELIAGSFMPGPDELAAVRKYVDRNHKAFTAMTQAKPLTSMFGALQGDQLQRVPRGYDSTHPAAPLLRATQFYYRRVLPRTVVTSPRFVAETSASFRAATPFVEAVDAALGNV